MSTTTATSLTEVLQEKLNKRIEEGITNSKRFLDKIEREGNILNDYIVPLGGYHHDTNDNIRFFPNETRVKMHVGCHDDTVGDTTENAKTFYIHPHAVRQAGERFGVPTGYIGPLADSGEPWKIKLASHILNEHSGHVQPKNCLIREVAGEIRGILSNKYRRLNSSLIYAAFIQAVNKQDGRIYSAYADDTRSWIETLYPALVTVPTSKNGIIDVAFGMRISTSDYGDGALELKTFILQAICMNGMVVENKIREIHLGRRIADNIEFSEQTMRFDTQTQASAVNDMVCKFYDRESIYNETLRIQQASNTTVELDKEFKLLPKSGMLNPEIEQLKTVITNNRAEDGVQGENTLWKLAQGVGAVANLSQDERRKRELHEISGKLIQRVNPSD